MSDTSKFKTGHTYYTEGGDKVSLDAMTDDGRFVVRRMIVVYEQDDQYETESDTAIIVSKLFTKAPRPVIDEELAALHEEAARLRRENAALRSQATVAEKEVEDRLAALSKYDGLERLEDFIENRITHVVVLGYTDYEIKTLSEFEADYDRYDKGLRLISLFGDSKGNLSWRVNRYKDDSGSWQTIIPCGSEEEAKKLRNEAALKDIDHKLSTLEPGRHNAFWTACVRAEKLGITIPDDALKRYRSIELDIAKKNIENLTKSAEQANDAVKTTKARIRELSK